jgi:hypothetical protein
MGLVCNPGEAPVEGYTSILAVLIAAASIKAGIYPLLTAKLIGILCTAATLAIVLFCGDALSARERVLASLFLLLCPDVAFYAVSGMENAWALPIVAYIVIRHMRPESFSSRTYALTGGLLALLCYLRPEGHLIALFVVAWHARRNFEEKVS